MCVFETKWTEMPLFKTLRLGWFTSLLRSEPLTRAVRPFLSIFVLFSATLKTPMMTFTLENFHHLWWGLSFGWWRDHTGMWDMLLPYAKAAYISSINRSTERSPLRL
jgi:hypothetical protein